MSARPPRILVVDDDEMIRLVVEEVLTDEGYDVQSAVDGAAALRRVREWPPDLILLDLRMPVMNGWEFTEAYRGVPPPHAHVVAMTAAYDTESFVQGTRVDSVLPKPFDLDELTAVAARWTGSGD